MDAAPEIEWEEARASVLGALRPQLAEREREEVVAELIDLGARELPRPRFLKALETALPALRAVGGTAVMEALARAVREVGEWYP